MIVGCIGLLFVQNFPHQVAKWHAEQVYSAYFNAQQQFNRLRGSTCTLTQVSWTRDKPWTMKRAKVRLPNSKVLVLHGVYADGWRELKAGSTIYLSVPDRVEFDEISGPTHPQAYLVAYSAHAWQEAMKRYNEEAPRYRTYTSSQADAIQNAIMEHRMAPHLHP